MGQTIALTILYEVGELTRFANVKVFSSYCRVVPGIAQSGNVTRRGRASKQGNHYLKAAFSQAAVHAVRCYPKVRRYYERQMKRAPGTRATDDLLQHHRPQTGPGRFPCIEGAN